MMDQQNFDKADLAASAGAEPDGVVAELAKDLGLSLGHPEQMAIRRLQRAEQLLLRLVVGRLVAGEAAQRGHVGGGVRRQRLGGLFEPLVHHRGG